LKIKLIVIARTDAAYLQEGIGLYVSRLKHYVNFDYLEIPALKNAGQIELSELKKREGDSLLKQIDAGSVVVALDEAGKEYTSLGFAKFIQQQMNSGAKTLVFLVGGAFGFSEEVYKRANFKLALSQMTFSHQQVRLFFVEQVYRAFTIIKGEKYHH
jgi:23S rRNA (pseudouridine1915-N3)-methyltransferase